MRQRLQPVDLFADVSLGGEEGRLLMQPAGVEIGGGIHQQADLLGNALADRRRLARRIGLGPQRQRLDGVDMAAEQRTKRIALALARLLQPGERHVQRRQDRRIERGPRLFGLDGFRHIQHAT
ncbi:hypothetical protein AJ88_29670 [Mesorhizobium amorphae CCBAU 01583]|nr:hypothetical protein AJ88_29670 [Mesorhizobium amorphae CCBAU 01583]